MRTRPRSRSGVAALGAAAGLAALATSCAATRPEPEAHAVPAAPVERRLAVTFAYRALDGREITSETTRGRPTVLAFVTTFDLASQVQVRALQRLFASGGGSHGAIAVVLEPAGHRVLVEAFRDSSRLSYPVVHEAVEGLERDGPFGTMDRVPTVVVLDAAGVERWRKRGLASPRELEEALAAAGRR